VGYALIKSGGTDGRYTIELDYGKAQGDAIIAAYTAKRIALENKLSSSTVAIAEADARELALKVALAEEFEIYAATPPEEQDILKVAQAIERLEIERAKNVPLRLKHVALRFDLKATQSELAKWVAFNPVSTRGAWCVDFTEDAEGYVGTIEIPGEPSLTLIVPGGRGWIPFDGIVKAREVQSPWQAYWNAAVLPGWQKWKPTYRWGTITEIDHDTDTCSVSLAAATSSAQGLNANKQATLSNVPISYMQCNSAPFVAGDRVVVEFVGQDPDAPQVIGFVDNPRACSWTMAGAFPLSVGRSGPIFVDYSADSFALLSTATFDARENRGEWIPMINISANPAVLDFTAVMGIIESDGTPRDVLASLVVYTAEYFSSVYPLYVVDNVRTYAWVSDAGQTSFWDGVGPRAPLSTFEIRARTSDGVLRLNVASFEIGWGGEFLPVKGKSAGGYRRLGFFPPAEILDYELYFDTGD